MHTLTNVSPGDVTPIKQSTCAPTTDRSITRRIFNVCVISQCVAGMGSLFQLLEGRRANAWETRRAVC